MKELINRDDAIRIAEQGQVQGYEWQFKKLCSLPSTEIINCIDCKYSYLYKSWDSPDWVAESRFCEKMRLSWSISYDMPVEDYDCCSFGDRKQ